MSDLLQGDVTQESAEIALLNYLAKLDEVAKLEPCGTYYEEDDTSTEINDDVIHLVARTTGVSRKYYYTRRQDGYWKPWEGIRLDIEDNPVTPVVWRGRLLLFWLKVLEDTKVIPDEMPTTVSGDGALGTLSLGTIKGDAKASAQQVVKVTVKAILAWSEYYNGKWQPARTSEVSRAVLIGHFAPNVFERSQLRLSVYDKEPGNARSPLVVEVKREGFTVPGERFIIHNTHSLPEQSSSVSQPNNAVRSLSSGGPLFTASYDQFRFQDEVSGLSNLERPILRNRTGDAMAAVAPLHDHLRNPWDAPFMVGDSRHLFFVSTSRRQVFIPPDGGYAPLVLLQKAAQLPPLVQLDRPIGERPVPAVDPSDTQAAFGVISTGAVKRFVTEDIYIHRALGTSGTVRIGNTEIGPAGGLTNGKPRG